MTKTTIQINETRQPNLTRAVLRQTGRENMPDLVNLGASASFGGLTYYSDTVPFATRNKAAILARLESDARELGYDSVLALLRSFDCLKRYSLDAIADGLYNPRSKYKAVVYNALAWYAAEEVAKELNPDGI